MKNGKTIEAVYIYIYIYWRFKQNKTIKGITLIALVVSSKCCI